MATVTKAPPRLQKILIADDEHLVVEGLVKTLRELDYQVVGTCPNGQDAVDFCRLERPDLALLDIQMPTMNGLDAARILYNEMRIPVVIISAYSDPEYTQTSADIGVFGYLLKPVSQDTLRVSLSVAWSQFLSQLDQQSQIDDYKQRLEDRKIIEKAKWVLVERLSITEEDAMKRLQKQARDNRRSLADTARSILENQALFGV